jgi:hypothetical protein
MTPSRQNRQKKPQQTGESSYFLIKKLSKKAFFK